MTTERTERRAHPRVHLAAQVDVELESRSFLAMIRNVSAGGLLIYTANPLPQNERLQLTFVLPDTKRTIRARAVVRQVTSGTSMGVEFEGLSTEDAAAIRVFVEKSYTVE